MSDLEKNRELGIFGCRRHVTQWKINVLLRTHDTQKINDRYLRNPPHLQHAIDESMAEYCRS